jgi:hypothetical protein
MNPRTPAIRRKHPGRLPPFDGDPVMARISSFRESGERYSGLRVLATICNAVGVLLVTLSALLLFAGIVSLIMRMVGPFDGVYLGIALVWSFGLFAAGIQSLAMGALFRLAIHVEENTRACAQALDRLRASVEPKPEVDPRSIFLS